MRLLINDYSGHPFAVQLSRQLASRGHVVLHTYCQSYVSGKGRLELEPSDPAGLSIEALDLGAEFAKHSIIRRLRQERTYGRRLAAMASRFGPEAIISANMPLFAQREIMRWSRRARVGFVFWLQDITSTAMNAELQRRFGRISAPGRSYLRRLEARMLRHSDVVVAISADFRDALDQWGVDPARVEVIENWAPLNEITPGSHQTAWAAEQGLLGRDVLLYAGTLGLKHDPGLLVELAAQLRDLPAAVVVVASEGSGADFCRAEAARRALVNLRVIPFQPYERLGEMLRSAHVVIAILEAGAGVFSVPSKILSYLCTGRPILAALPPENLASRLLREADAGIVVAPEDRQGFAAGARRLLEDRDESARLGHNARRHADKLFDIESIADRFEAVLSRAREETPAGWT